MHPGNFQYRNHIIVASFEDDMKESSTTITKHRPCEEILYFSRDFKNENEFAKYPLCFCK